jgi:Methane/Phenol/Toluene Hydroxylase.
MSAPAPPTKKLGHDVRDDQTDVRQFAYFTPAGRRATMYEDVTCDIQASPQRHQLRGYGTAFADGRSPWQLDSTRLSVEDWYSFRDPSGLWERSYYQSGTRYERSIEDAVNVAVRDGHLDRLDKGWVEFLRENFQQLAFVEHGIWLLLAVAARDGLSDTITHCMCFEAAMKQRQAQAVVLYAMDLEPSHGEFSIKASKESFIADDPWQPLRKVLEELATVTDWGERVFAVNVCIEPLVGTLLRRELFLRGSGLTGDTTLPTLLNVAQLEYQFARDWTDVMLKMVTSSEQHGPANADVLEDWSQRWLPKVREAAAALRPVFESGPDGLDFDAAVQATECDLAAILEAAGMNDVKVAVGA